MEFAVLTPSGRQSPKNIHGGPPRCSAAEESSIWRRLEPGLTIPVEYWRPEIPIPEAVLFDVDSTLFKSEALHDFGHHRLVSEVYLQLPHGHMWDRKNWDKWLLRDNPEYPLVPHHPAIHATPYYHRRLLTEGSCFFRAETEVIERIHHRLLFLSNIEGTGVPRGVANRFLDTEQYKSLKSRLMIDAMTGQGPRYQLELIEGARQLVDLVLQHNIPFALGTGSPRGIVESMLRCVGLYEHVRHSVTSDDLWCPERKIFRPGKPDPLTFNLGFKQLTQAYQGVRSPERVYVFEDQAKGAHSARRGGFTALLCPDPTNGKTIQEHVEELRELERQHPCAGHPPVVVAQHIDQGWRPFIETIFIDGEKSEQKANVV